MNSRARPRSPIPFALLLLFISLLGIMNLINMKEGADRELKRSETEVPDLIKTDFFNTN